jgi:hypothetical protein
MLIELPREASSFPIENIRDFAAALLRLQRQFYVFLRVI